jgi:hypothetical protein
MQICGRLAIQGKPSYRAVSEARVPVSTDGHGFAATLATVNNIVCLTLGLEHDSDVVICCTVLGIIVQVRHFIGS